MECNFAHYRTSGAGEARWLHGLPSRCTGGHRFPCSSGRDRRPGACFAACGRSRDGNLSRTSFRTRTLLVSGLHLGISSRFHQGKSTAERCYMRAQPLPARRPTLPTSPGGSGSSGRHLVSRGDGHRYGSRLSQCGGTSGLGSSCSGGSCGGGPRGDGGGNVAGPRGRAGKSRFWGFPRKHLHLAFLQSCSKADIQWRGTFQQRPILHTRGHQCAGTPSTTGRCSSHELTRGGPERAGRSKFSKPFSKRKAWKPRKGRSWTMVCRTWRWLLQIHCNGSCFFR